MIRVTWLGHACFKLQCQGHSIVIDPYNDMVPLPPLKASAGAVLASHGHGDHNYFEAVSIIDEPGENPFTVRTVACFHDDQQGALRGENLIHIIEAEGMKLVHFGDLGHDLSTEQLSEIGEKVTAVMIPVGEGPTISIPTALKHIEALAPTVVIPMHYGLCKGFEKMPFAPIDKFLAAIEGENVVRISENYIDIDADTPKQVAVLSFKG